MAGPAASITVPAANNPAAEATSRDLIIGGPPCGCSPGRGGVTTTRQIPITGPGVTGSRGFSSHLTQNRGSARSRSALVDGIPHHAGGASVKEQLRRVVLVDVPDQRVVDAESAQLLQAWLEAAQGRQRDAELLVLLLADPARAVVHRHTHAAPVRGVGAPPVPQAAVP